MPGFYENLVRRILFGLEAETAHELGIELLRFGLATEAAQNMAAKRFATNDLPVERFGLAFPNPMGVAAGFDKNGIVVNQLASLGFGFVEVGTVTYRPQKGNEKPRMFRLPEDRALINRLGFNNEGAEVVVDRLSRLRRKCVIGVNIGKNRDVPNEEAIENYLAAFDLVHPVADYVAVNISSPNTPNLRELQKAENLESLLGALSERNHALSSGLHQQSSDSNSTGNAEVGPAEGGDLLKDTTRGRKPLLVKIAPDISEGEIEAVVDVCLRTSIDGVIATNTTISREGLRTPDVETLGPGGLSGGPLRSRSTQVIRTIYGLSRGRLPIMGVGGIFNAEDAFEKISAGASLLQAYTGFVYQGPSFARNINEGLAKILKQRGFSSVDDAIGSGT